MSQYSYLKRVKVDVIKLKVGMYVGALDKPWEESPFLFQGFAIEDREQLDQIKRECRHVFVDFRDNEDYENFLMQPDQLEDIPEIERNDAEFAKELPLALKIFKDAVKSNKLLMRKIQQGQLVDYEAAGRITTDCISSLRRNDRALLVLLSIQNKIFYTTEHPVRVSILALAFGLYLKMSDEQLQILGTSALLHDVGKLTVPEKILNKEGKLNNEEISLLRKHPVESYRLLDKVEGISEIVKEVALSHHERQDGKGYPRNIHKDRVSRYAKVVSIIDAYDAIISDRPYRKNQSPSEALKILNNHKDSKFDGQLVGEFVKWIGVMPIGALIELATGEIGIVLKNNPQKKLKPLVMLVTDEHKKPGLERIIDLSKVEMHASGKPYQVKAVLPNHSFGINIEQYLKKQLFNVPSWIKEETKSPFLNRRL